MPLDASWLEAQIPKEKHQGVSRVSTLITLTKESYFRVFKVFLCTPGRNRVCLFQWHLCGTDELQGGYFSPGVERYTLLTLSFYPCRRSPSMSFIAKDLI